MNFLAHGCQFLERPYFIAGTAVPDWMNVVDRRIRARSRRAEPFLNDPREAMQEVASGIMRHHQDDAWFHRNEAFNVLNLKFTVAATALLPADQGFRTSFLGHILVELLLDAELFRREPSMLDDYYASLEKICPETVANFIGEMTGKDASKLAAVIHRFRTTRFLADYATDAGLLMRINGVMARVGLPLLPDKVLSLLRDARREVAERADDLLTPVPPPSA